MNVRAANKKDLDEICEIIEKAKEHMREEGNCFQWNNGYPNNSVFLNDIKKGQLFVWEDATSKKIHGVFAFILGEDPTYEIIEDGKWPNGKPYATIHRMASDGEKKGMLKDCMEFCVSQIDEIRLDTHELNVSMKIACQRAGFKRCGIIYVADGSPRIAFQFSLEKNNNRLPI